MKAIGSERSATRTGHHSPVSPMIHQAGVKQESGGKASNIRKNNNSLSSFTYSPVPARATPARAYMRVCVRGAGERVKHGHR